MYTVPKTKEEYYMALWEGITKGAKDAASYTVKKTGELTALAKLKIALHGEESKLEKCFEDIGELYYCKEKNAECTCDAQLSELVKAADEIKAKIAELKAEISKLQGTTLCAKCGSCYNGDFAFCPKCGAKKEQKEEADK